MGGSPYGYDSNGNNIGGGMNQGGMGGMQQGGMGGMGGMNQGMGGMGQGGRG